MVQGNFILERGNVETKQNIKPPPPHVIEILLPVIYTVFNAIFEYKSPLYYIDFIY